MRRIYLDNAATTKLAPEVLEKMLPFLSDSFGNASCMHHEGRITRLAIETARKSVARNVGANSSSIFFTSGGTEANNLAIRSLVRDYKITNIITARTEHQSVLATVRDLHHKGQIKLSYVALKQDGSVDLSDLDRLLEKEHGRTLVTLMYANNEMGALLKIQSAGEICKSHKAFFHSDCVQAVGHYSFNLSETAIDIITASGHKFHGPKGSGMIYVREGMEIRPLITGGGQERNVRSGTENVAGIVGFAEALLIATENMDADSYHINQLKHRLISILHQMGIDCNGDMMNSLYTVVSAAFPNHEQTASLLMDLDKAGISTSGGSACSASKGGSHVMEAIGATKTNNIRFSFSKYNTIEELDNVEQILKNHLVNEYAGTSIKV